MTPHSLPSFSRLLQKVTPQNVVHFKYGLPGFPEEKEFVIMQSPEDKPLAWLQSLNTADLAFVITSPFVLFPEYRPDVPDEDIAEIGSPPLDQVLVLSILKLVNTTPPQLYTNLKAPIVVNILNFQARQAILVNESMYSERAVYNVAGA